MKDPGILLYLVFLAVILVSQYLKRRRASHQRRENQGFEFPQDQESPYPATPADLISKAPPDPSVGKFQTKPAHTSGYRSINPPQEAAPDWNTQKAALKKSLYRDQFKNHSGIQQAVVNMVVLGPCRADEPYQHK